MLKCLNVIREKQQKGAWSVVIWESRPLIFLAFLFTQSACFYTPQALQRNAVKAQNSPAMQAEADLLQSQRLLPQAMDLVRAGEGL